MLIVISLVWGQILVEQGVDIVTNLGLLLPFLQVMMFEMF